MRELDERLCRLPDPELGWLDDLLDPHQAVPAPCPSRTVRAIQRGMRAENASAVAEGGVWPDTHGTPAEAVSGPAGPVCSLSPKWGAA